MGERVCCENCLRVMYIREDQIGEAVRCDECGTLIQW